MQPTERPKERSLILLMTNTKYTDIRTRTRTRLIGQVRVHMQGIGLYALMYTDNTQLKLVKRINIKNIKICATFKQINLQESRVFIIEN